MTVRVSFSIEPSDRAFPGVSPNPPKPKPKPLQGALFDSSGNLMFDSNGNPMFGSS
jgi:hypothetical protein